MRTILSLSLFAVSAFGFQAPDLAPQTQTLEPRVGRPGTIIKIKGFSLDRAHVEEVYLTDHRFDLKVKVLEQSARELTIRVPPFVKPGRLQLLILTGGSRPVYLEQPLYVEIENPDEDLPATPPPPVHVSKKGSKSAIEVASVGAAIPVPTDRTPIITPSAPAPAAQPGVTAAAPPPTPTPVKTEVPQTAPPPTTTTAAAPPATAPPPPAKPEVAKLEPPAQLPQPAQTLPQTQPQPAPSVVHVPQSQAQPPAAGQAEAATNGFVPAQVVRKTRVTYPGTAMQRRIEGEVELIAVVRPDGRVKSVKIIKGNPFLTSAAASGLSEWIYEPARQDGVAIETEVPVVMHFTLPK